MLRFLFSSVFQISITNTSNLLTFPSYLKFFVPFNYNLDPALRAALASAPTLHYTYNAPLARDVLLGIAVTAIILQLSLVNHTVYDTRIALEKYFEVIKPGW